jgi:trans-aconitate 2-methyltransferase
MKKDAENYSWNAKDYAKHSSNQLEWAQELIPKLKLLGNENLLDIGCGDGKITAILSTCLPKGQVLGIDNSQEMITLAYQCYTQDAYPNLSFRKMDARKLPFKEQFDVIFSNAALHWITDHRSLLIGVANSLRKKGRILFQMGGKGNARDILLILDSLLAEERWKHFFTDFQFPYGFYSPFEYKEWLLEVGMKPERVELLPKNMKLQGREGLLGWLRTTWLPYTQRLPANLKEPFLGEIADKYLEAYPPDSNGIVQLKMSRLEVQASKACKSRN